MTDDARPVFVPTPPGEDEPGPPTDALADVLAVTRAINKLTLSIVQHEHKICVRMATETLQAMEDSQDPDHLKHLMRVLVNNMAARWKRTT